MEHSVNFEIFKKNCSSWFKFSTQRKIWSLRNHEGDAAEDNVDKKKNLYFTYESRDTLKSFTMFTTVKTITKLNPEHSDKFEKEKEKNSRRGPRSSAQGQIWSFDVLDLQRTHKETYQELQRTCKAIDRLIKPFVL